MELFACQTTWLCFCCMIFPFSPGTMVLLATVCSFMGELFFVVVNNGLHYPTESCPFSHTHESGRLWIAAHYQSLHAHTNPGGLTFEYFIIFAQVDAPMPMSECRDQSTGNPFALPKLTRSPKHGNFTQMALSTPGPHKTQDGEWLSTVAKTTPTAIASAHCTPLFASTKRINASLEPNRLATTQES